MANISVNPSNPNKGISLVARVIEILFVPNNLQNEDLNFKTICIVIGLTLYQQVLSLSTFLYKILISCCVVIKKTYKTAHAQLWLILQP